MTIPTVAGGGPPYPPVDFDYGKAQEVVRQLDALIPFAATLANRAERSSRETVLAALTAAELWC